MKSLWFLALLPAVAIAQVNTGNPLYDFPEQIVKKNGTGFGHVNGNLNDLSIAGFYDESRSYEDSFGGPPPRPVYISLQNKKVLDARNLILQQAARYRILLINEAHNRPEHRLFTKSLLEGLHTIGYNVFMAEGIKLNNGIDKRGYPVSTDGYLLNEPVYGSLIRYAGKIGYSVYGYEYDSQKEGKSYWDDSVKLDKYGSIKYISYQPRDSMMLIFDENGLKTTIMTSGREVAQAENIMKVIAAHPTSKFIIHVGHGHLYEDGVMMGGKLRAMLKNEDLLTIDQVHITDRIAVIDIPTNDTIQRDFPFIIPELKEVPVDYQVCNRRRAPDSLGRPGLLWEDIEERRVYYLPENRRKDCPCLFTAYYQTELDKEKQNAIAIDIIEIKQQSIPLLLYKGDYSIIKKNRDGIYTNFKVTIK